jgi:hypothetical protein
MKDWLEKLTNAIAGQLGDKIFIKPDVFHYLESATGVNTAAGLEQQLKGADSSEICTLLELIFFPDKDQQCEIEPILENAVPEKKHVNLIKETLSGRQITTRFIFPDNTMTGPIPVPVDAIDAYIRRLNLAQTIDKTVGKAICNHINDRRQALEIRVILRKSRIKFTSPVVSFLCDFFRIMPAKSQNLTASLTEALAVLESGPADMDIIYCALMNQKRLYAEIIRRQENTSGQLRQIPVEALIMRGASIGAMGGDEARKKMSIIDEIAINIFGQTQFVEYSDNPVTISI